MTSRRSRARLLRERHRSAPTASGLGRLPGRPSPLAIGAGLLASGAGLAFLNARLASRAERANPPAGRFVEVDGLRLHYVERGTGDPLVLLHGNGSMVQDFETSGLVDLAARNYRVIAFDRPGFGWTERPRDTIWTARAQARLIGEALRQLGVAKATVLGHSWGTTVALNLALEEPDLVGSLVLASGYYYPTARADVVIMSQPAIPVIGDVLRYTVSPLLGRLIWPLLMRKIFGPAPAPEKFDGFPREMALRPSQIRASAAETALMIPDAFADRDRYGELRIPVVIIAGEEDRVVDIDRQSARLHGDVEGSTLHRLPGQGHMIHQTATAAVMAAIHEAAKRPSAAAARRQAA